MPLLEGDAEGGAKMENNSRCKFLYSDQFLNLESVSVYFDSIRAEVEAEMAGEGAPAIS